MTAQNQPEADQPDTTLPTWAQAPTPDRLADDYASGPIAQGETRPSGSAGTR